MEIDLFALLDARPEILLFLVIGLGYLIGKVKVRGFELGSAGGVLFAALVFGHYGLEVPRPVSDGTAPESDAATVEPWWETPTFWGILWLCLPQRAWRQMGGI